MKTFKITFENITRKTMLIQAGCLEDAKQIVNLEEFNYDMDETIDFCNKFAIISAEEYKNNHVK